MKKNSVLIIEDEELIRDTLGNDLTEAGYSVCTAESGEEGILCFGKRQHDLVIVDLVMEGMGGIDVIRKIMELRPDTKIIVLTGYGTQESAIESLRLGVSDYLVKPCDRKLLLNSVSELLDKSSSRGLKIRRDKMFSMLQNYHITLREREICEMLLSGKPREEISNILHISKNTVDTHVKNIYKKLDVSSFPKLLEKLL